MSDTPHASSNFPWPPAIYLAAVGAALLLTWLWPLGLLRDASAPTQWTIRAAGALIIVAGFVIGFSAQARFIRAGTPVPPMRPTTALVTGGIYQYTRNPMYLGMTIVLIGLSFAFLSAWPLLATPLAIYAVIKLAIEREERYLGAKFGDAYVDYCSRVRRWI